MNKGNELFHTHTYLFIHVAGDAQGRRRRRSLLPPDDGAEHQVPAACVTTARGPTANDRGARERRVLGLCLVSSLLVDDVLEFIGDDVLEFIGDDVLEFIGDDVLEVIGDDKVALSPL